MADVTGTIAANVIGAVIGGVIGAVGGAFLGKWLADRLGITGFWARAAFIGAVGLLVGATAAAIGYFIGPYVAKIWSTISSRLICMLKGAYKGFKFAANHMMQAKHAWNLVLGNNVTENAVKKLVIKAITRGSWEFLANGAIHITFRYKGQIIEVTGRIMNFLFTISDAWVRTK